MMVESSNRQKILMSKILFRACWLGTIDYQPAYELQKKLWTGILNRQSENVLLMLEHTPTVTLGKSGNLDNLRVSSDELTARGISLFFTDRGGDITYHGPGQLVIYPILNLADYQKNIHQYIYNLQETAILTLHDFSILASRDEQLVGVWVGGEKIAAIGVAVHRWVTMHGLAINVHPLMEHYNLINPCGITDKGVTSMAKLLSREITVREVAATFTRHFSAVFDADIKTILPEML
jgi:lipoyl(octanoyl) transferase